MIYLYVKTHNITGLKYFGKTTKSDPHKYAGSGVYWKRHLIKYGRNYSTEIIASFTDEKECINFALQFSKENNIVESTDWANLQEENGVDGAPKGHIGHKFTEEQITKLSSSSKNRWENPEYKEKLRQKQKDSWTEQRREEQSKRLTGQKNPEHSKKMKGRKLDPSHPFLSYKRTEKHKSKISESLKGKPKSEDHKKKLSTPKIRICRLHDRKEISVNAYTRWLKTVK